MLCVAVVVAEVDILHLPVMTGVIPAAQEVAALVVKLTLRFRVQTVLLIPEVVAAADHTIHGTVVVVARVLL
jgi:hypothetical protein